MSVQSRGDMTETEKTHYPITKSAFRRAQCSHDTLHDSESRSATSVRICKKPEALDFSGASSSVGRAADF